MKAFLIFFLILIFYFPAAEAQRHCLTEELQELRQARYPDLQKQHQKLNDLINSRISNNTFRTLSADTDEEVYHIPVVVHVIHKDVDNNPGKPGSTNISDEQIYTQIKVLNEDFRNAPGTPAFNADPVAADVNIEFCLATRDPDGEATTGINRLYNPKSTWDYNDDRQLKALVHWPADKYLNIYVVDMPSGDLGYAQYPSGSELAGIGSDYNAETDGVVIDYHAFGTTGTASYPYDMGRTVTHEVGHWLGLLHIWGSGCTSDYVDDTPPDAGGNLNSNCRDSSDCDRNGVYTPDMTENYMDYSNDQCMNLFTHGQKERMRTVMEVSPMRRALLNSAGCCREPVIYTAPYSQDFEGDIFNEQWQSSSPAGRKEWHQELFGYNSASSVSVAPEGIYNPETGDSLFVDYLASPAFSIQDLETPEMTFRLYYNGDITQETDCLVVKYMPNCLGWEHLVSYSGTDLISATDNNPGNNQWKFIAVDLSELKEYEVIKFRFEYYSKGKSSLYMDDLNISTPGDELLLKAFPNPFSTSLFVTASFPGQQNLNITIMDITGRIVDELTIRDAVRLENYEIQLRNYQPGVYFFRFHAGEYSKVRKLLRIR